MNLRFLFTLAMAGLLWCGTLPTAAAPTPTTTKSAKAKKTKGKKGKKKAKASKDKKKGKKRGEVALPDEPAPDAVYFDLQEAKRHLGAQGLSDIEPDLYLVDSLNQKDYKTAAALITAGADVNKPGPKGELPLLLAAGSGNSALVKLMLSHEAEISSTDANGLNAMDIAARNGQLRIIDLLHAKGLAPAAPEGIENPDIQSYLNNLD